ncbi:FG-GAP-like repeat-containing protein [Spirosoma sp.]|uniref:FG-GAP-like repeat-containing protein n=1 Tax=Spirosoma sp. TaxID=1899569 RepID=UPI003B3A3CF6
MKKLFTLCLLFIPFLTYAQSGGKISFQYDPTPPVSVNRRSLLNPWAGGLNATQYSTIRLNNDARDDLMVYDRTTSKISTFIAVDNPAGTGIVWQHAPEYETAFPAISGWILLVDYDQDGQKDIFTPGSGNVLVYHNESKNGQLAFKLVANPLMTEGYSGKIQLYISSVDIPAITDYDDDGDIDIITFDVTGNLIAYQQNMSVERTGQKGGLDFKRYQNLCWGHFQKEYCNDFVFGIQCDGSGRVGLSTGSARPMHTGNTLTVVDTDGDGLKDLLFGFVSCENIARLRNAGPNNEKANFVSYDSLFPAANPILFPAFPATFLEDVDGDGLKDLLASPNVSLNENQLFDFRASGWFYRNTGTSAKPNFQLAEKDFLQRDMLDLGERAAPALADLDGDGDMDLLVGYDGVGFGTNYKGGIWQFENKGTTQAPSFSLVTTDYLGINQSLKLTNVMPSFVDVDANGSLDLVITATGASGMEIRVLLNAAAKGVAPQYNLTGATLWPVPDRFTPGDLLTVTDIDQDGKQDVLIGKEYGTIEYFRNTGSAVTPVFQLQNQAFGGFTINDLTYARARSIVVADINGDQTNELILAANNGTVRVYQFPNPVDKALTLLDSLPSIGFPGMGLIATVADLNGDELPDLILGSVAGGLRYLRNTSQKVVTGIEEEPTGSWAFPNPTERYLTIRPFYDATVEVLSLTGQVVLSGQTVRANVETVVDLKNVASGTYLIRLIAENRPTQVQKLIVLK